MASQLLPKCIILLCRLQGLVEAGQRLVGTQRSAKKSTLVVEKRQSPTWKEQQRDGDENLVGCGIKIWWPLDRRFYKGEVVSYDSKKKRHRVLYDDGEQEVLNLLKERWELTGERKGLKVRL
jgi:sister-chromatid-cohesion protein PDS5